MNVEVQPNVHLADGMSLDARPASRQQNTLAAKEAADCQRQVVARIANATAAWNGE